MNLSFEEQALHDVCVDLERAEQVLGTVNAAALVAFISEVEAFENAEELMEFRDGEFSISEDDALSMAIGVACHVTLVAAGKRHSRDLKDRTDWRTVTRLKMTELSRAT